MKKLRSSLLLLAGICLASCSKSPNNKSNNATPKTTPVIVIMGSSSAAGGGATPPDSGWAYRLQTLTGSKANFTNLAYGGYTTYEALPTGTHSAARPAPDTTRNITKALSLKPALVILNYPNNDVAEDYSDDETLANYATLVHLLDSARVQYIIFGTQPRDFDDANKRMRLKTQNDKIKSIYTYHVNDYLAPLSTPTYSIKPQYEAGDGVHVNNAGHVVILNATLKQSIFMNLVK